MFKSIQSSGLVTDSTTARDWADWELGSADLEPVVLAPVPVGKRALDLVLTAAAVFAIAPVFGLVALAILVVDGRPVFYRHRRIGRGGRPFHCLKFRTMAIGAEAILNRHLACSAAARQEWQALRKLTDDPRVTRLGSFLRRSSLDELPQLWNVWKGEMSLVGPRPIVADELAQYGADQAAYLSVLPGMTGAWQVGGRSDTTYAERVAMDVDYVRTRSLMGDLGILLQTVGVVLRRSGAR
jgi:exopolysaccharide production protein ExoY